MHSVVKEVKTNLVFSSLFCFHHYFCYQNLVQIPYTDTIFDKDKMCLGNCKRPNNERGPQMSNLYKLHASFPYSSYHNRPCTGYEK